MREESETFGTHKTDLLLSKDKDMKSSMKISLG